MIFIPFHLHNSRSIAPISNARSPKMLFGDFSGQIPHGICNSTLCVINYECHSFCLTSFWCFLAVARPLGYFTPKGVFLSCLIATGFFELPGLAGGFRLYKKHWGICPSALGLFDFYKNIFLLGVFLSCDHVGFCKFHIDSAE